MHVDDFESKQLSELGLKTIYDGDDRWLEDCDNQNWIITLHEAGCYANVLLQTKHIGGAEFFGSESSYGPIY